ncbi:MAG: amidase, partial [Actinomycetota bacterium]|nr:amidase [Actinomycetota bacterium]
MTAPAQPATVQPAGAQPARLAAGFDQSVWRAAGDPLLPASGTGPLAGMSVAVKDLFAVEGFAVGAGNEDWLA